MKLVFHGHDERYTVEQSLMNLLPDERPVYAPPTAEDESFAVVSLSETGDEACATVEMTLRGKSARREERGALRGSEFDREGRRRYLIARAFYLAVRELTGVSPPWGMLTGVRPDKPATWALQSGKTPREVQNYLTEHYFLSPSRAALATQTASAAVKAARRLAPRDIDLYVSVPFCPTRCAYCSFVSQSVERSFDLVEPYVRALSEEIAAGGDMARRAGLRVRTYYVGGGTPTTLSPEQLHAVLTALETHFDLADCSERTVEAGRPDTITREKLAVLRSHGVTRVSVNPQAMDDNVLRAIGRRHTVSDVADAMALVREAGFAHVNMDLIAGLPCDTAEGFRRSLTACLAFGTDNLTVHTLALKKGSRITQEKTAIPSGETVRQMLESAEELLRGAGFAPYYLYRQKYMSGSFENIGWSREGAECLYNIDIMSELCSILSFGAGGSTKTVVPGTNRITRSFHPKYPAEYIAQPEKSLREIEAFGAFYENTVN